MSQLAARVLTPPTPDIHFLNVFHSISYFSFSFIASSFVGLSHLLCHFPFLTHWTRTLSCAYAYVSVCVSVRLRVCLHVCVHVYGSVGVSGCEISPRVHALVHTGCCTELHAKLHVNLNKKKFLILEHVIPFLTLPIIHPVSLHYCQSLVIVEFFTHYLFSSVTRQIVYCLLRVYDSHPHFKVTSSRQECVREICRAIRFLKLLSDVSMWEVFSCNQSKF